MPAPAPDPVSLSRAGRVTGLAVAFPGCLGAGGHMAIPQQTGRAPSIDLLARTGQLDASAFVALNKQHQDARKGTATPLAVREKEQVDAGEALVGRWFAWNQCAFLFGAAAGGLLFGWLGDRIGRAKGM